MGFLDRITRIFGHSEPKRHPVASDAPDDFPGWPAVTHPKFGSIFLEDEYGDYSMWLASECRFQHYTGPIDISFAGDLIRPRAEAIQACDWADENWNDVLKLIESEAYTRFYKPYADHFKGVPKYASPDQLWGTETLLGMGFKDRNDFSITLQFQWQQPGDDHQITFYVEEGKCVSHSVDG